MAPINPIDYTAIRNTIAEYCIALDTKDWPSLRNVFTDEVDAYYPFADMKGVNSVAAAIEKRLQHITSQHAVTTQTIKIDESGRTAKATTYFTGIHFGKGKWQGQQVTAWGKYVDDLILIDSDKDALPGASGLWRIEKRVVAFMSRLGEEGVMAGEDSEG